MRGVSSGGAPSFPYVKARETKASLAGQLRLAASPEVAQAVRAVNAVSCAIHRLVMPKKYSMVLSIESVVELKSSTFSKG